MTQTTSDDVLQRFCVSPRTWEIYTNWKKDARRVEVAPVVMAHRAELVYELSTADVEAVCHRTEHALGQVRRLDGESVAAIVDWHPDFAFTHVFHVCMEQMRRLPSYQDFRSYAYNDHWGLRMLGDPAKAKVHEVSATGVPERLARDAMRWRVGNAYYSFLREVYTVVQLRSMGLDLRVHPLADALFRVDAWVGNKVISLRVGNKKFRQGEGAGRKMPPERLLADVRPPLEFATLELSPATKFGSVHLPSLNHLSAAAARLSG
ncbi:hypothetical protein [Streptomyces violaceusniger]|uniref:Uncharacterized protein n=1 Tax=Streptomyces violaceusniger (strain Tu 4113) TaxID=653045 RepID=G2PBE9_STRV4|nr:hypothetical protein [Streptomyces violaceusniger]AEM80348.1 hypothetical protein Strvi_0571 [Streptomyces violaceusniger Tu 4113]